MRCSITLWQFAERAQITSGESGTVAKGNQLPFRLLCMRTAESTNCMQPRSCFAIPLREHKLEYKNGGEIKFFLTIRDSYTQQGLSNHIILRPIKSGATVR
jgi:hypothetical protein